MISQADKAQRFLELHRPGEPLLMPNPWDLGSAKLLASLGFAATLGRNDGSVSRDEAMIHAAVIVAATDLAVSADLENAYADDPAGAAETMRLAIEVGLAGASIEDFADEPGIYGIGQATERVAAQAVGNLIRLGVYECCNFASDFFTFCQPLIPMSVGVIHHLMVILSGRGHRRA